MSKAADLAARAAATRAGVKAESVVVKPRQKPVRLSTDVEPDDYKRLMSLCADIALNIGRVRVTQIDTLRAVTLELLENKDLQARVQARILAKKEAEGK
jgi:hypothetical protein